MAEHRLSDSCLASSLTSTISLALVADLVRWYFPVRTLVKFKLVSKEWKSWCDENLLQLAKDRRKDESRDWYFPITFDHHHRDVSVSRKWYGQHQWTEQHHALPDLDFLPDWRDDFFLIEAVSSGLLVLRKFPTPYDIILIVCNPLSKKWRMLSRHSNMSRPFGEIEDIHTHLVLDDMSNEYKVIRLSSEWVNVYSSSTNRWVCSPSDGPSPLTAFSACCNGRVYSMKFTEAVSYTWRYLLRIYDIKGNHTETKCIIFTNFSTQDFFDKADCRRPRDPILVECMGSLYAVAASCQGRHNFEVQRHNRGENFSVKTQFHIFKLTNEGELNMELGSWNYHVEVPVEMHVPEYHVFDLWKGCRHFSCVARSNMICLAWDYGYHLQYDVVSGLSRVYFAAVDRGDSLRHRGYSMAYSPSLDLEP